MRKPRLRGSLYSYARESYDSAFQHRIARGSVGLCFYADRPKDSIGSAMFAEKWTFDSADVRN